MQTMQKIWGALVSVLVLGGTATPFGASLDDDSFPFSTFPMFSTPRIDDRMALTRAVGIDATGARHALHPRYIGTEEVVAAGEILAQTAARGVEASMALCHGIAERVAQSNDAELRTVTSIWIATFEYRSLAFLAEHATPTLLSLHAHCEVAR